MASTCYCLWADRCEYFLSRYSCQLTKKIPQLWSACLPSDADEQTLRNRVAMISKFDTEREAQAKGKADDKKALDEARKKGKDAYTAEKARIALEKLTVAEAKKQDKLRSAAAKQAEKVRLAAERKAKAAEIRVSDFFNSTLSP